MFRKILRNVAIAVTGPFLTLFFIYAESKEIQPDEVPKYFAGTSIMLYTSIACFVSIASHMILKPFWKAMVVSVTSCWATYVSIFAYYSLSDPIHWREYLMWMPIMMFYVMAITLPIAGLISYGIGDTIRALRERSKRSEPPPPSKDEESSCGS